MDYLLDQVKLQQRLKEIFQGDVPDLLPVKSKALLTLRLQGGANGTGKKYSQPFLEKKSGVSQGTISRLERGEITTTDPAALLALAIALGVNLTVIAHGVPANIKDDVKNSPHSSGFKFVLNTIESNALQFGVRLGWQLGGYDFFKHFKIKQAKEHSANSLADIKLLLELDGTSNHFTFNNPSKLMKEIQLYYVTKSEDKHTAICLGICGARIVYMHYYLAVANQEHTADQISVFNDWGFAALTDVPERKIPNKKVFYGLVVDKRASQISEYIAYLEELFKMPLDIM